MLLYVVLGFHFQNEKKRKKFFDTDLDLFLIEMYDLTHSKWIFSLFLAMKLIGT